MKKIFTPTFWSLLLMCSIALRWAATSDVFRNKLEVKSKKLINQIKITGLDINSYSKFLDLKQEDSVFAKTVLHVIYKNIPQKSELKDIDSKIKKYIEEKEKEGIPSKKLKEDVNLLVESIFKKNDSTSHYFLNEIFKNEYYNFIDSLAKRKMK